MPKFAAMLVILNAAIHTYIAWFEIFAWQSRGPHVFSALPETLFIDGTAMAANQGLYNSFLATGLIWALLIDDPVWKRKVATCFLCFIAVAGIFGALTVDTKTIFVQLVPSLAAIAAIWLLKPKAVA